MIEADIDFDPDTLNLTSGGRWVTCYIQLPDPYAADGIDPDGVLFNGILPAEKSGVTDHDGDGIGELMVKFSREAVESMLAEGDAVTVTVSGTAGNVGFSGTDVIRVIRRGKDGGKKKNTALFQSAETVGSASAGPTGAMEIFYAHPDHLGTPQAMTDGGGNVVWKADYRPFGEAEVMIGDVGNEIRFPGQYYDAETGLHYNWHRYYDPETGRYLRADPIGLAGGINLYPYVEGNPINYIDPTGENAVLAGAGLLLGGFVLLAAMDQLPDLELPDFGNDDCDEGCPPCKTISGKIVPVGTMAYRPLEVFPDDVVQHGVAGSHHNIFIAQQNPNNCQCFWQKQKYVLKPEELPADAIPIEPFAN